MLAQFLNFLFISTSLILSAVISASQVRLNRMQYKSLSTNQMSFQIKVRYYKLECPKENETKYFKNIVCRIENNQKTSQLSIFADLVLSIDYVVVTYSLTHRTSQRVAINTSVEYCKTEKYKLDIINILLDIIKTASVGLTQECPLRPAKQLGLHKFSVESLQPVISLVNFQRGDYMGEFNFYDKKRIVIFFVRSYASITKRRN